MEACGDWAAKAWVSIEELWGIVDWMTGIHVQCQIGRKIIKLLHRTDSNELRGV